ncbi:MAG TPA: diguanylate cyclase [Candidatus Obscuribacterales bacterium]
MADDKKKKTQEAEFYRRVAELRSRNNQFPWTSGEIPVFELPAEQTKLYADVEADEAELTMAELEKRALMDLIAPTYNFRTFYKRLHYELKRANRYDRQLSLLIVAVDGLDEVFKTLGVDDGDIVVAAAAAVMLKSIRDVDLIGRCRDDAFGIILPETARSGAEVAAERIRTKLEHYEVAGKRRMFVITASIGVSCFTGRPLVDSADGQGPSVQDMFGKAAAAVLKQMRAGGNGITFADEDA